MRLPGKNTRVGCHFLLQRIFPIQGSNPCLLHWQVGSLPLSHQETITLPFLKLWQVQKLGCLFPPWPSSQLITLHLSLPYWGRFQDGLWLILLFILLGPIPRAGRLLKSPKNKSDTAKKGCVVAVLCVALWIFLVKVQCVWCVCIYGVTPGMGRARDEQREC